MCMLFNKQIDRFKKQQQQHQQQKTNKQTNKKGKISNTSRVCCVSQNEVMKIFTPYYSKSKNNLTIPVC